MRAFAQDRFETLLTWSPALIMEAACYTIVVHFIALGLFFRKVDQASLAYAKEQNSSAAVKDYSAVPFDSRFGGYTEKEADEYLRTLGPKGRTWYLAFEIFDSLMIMPGYVTLLGLLAAWMVKRMRATPLETQGKSTTMRCLYATLSLLPLGTAGFDLAENVCQALMTAGWTPSSTSSSVWTALVGIGSACVIVKYCCLAAYASLYLFLGIRMWWLLRRSVNKTCSSTAGLVSDQKKEL